MMDLAQRLLLSAQQVEVSDIDSYLILRRRSK